MIIAAAKLGYYPGSLLNVSVCTVCVFTAKAEETASCFNCRTQSIPPYTVSLLGQGPRPVKLIERANKLFQKVGRHKVRTFLQDIPTVSQRK